MILTTMMIDMDHIEMDKFTDYLHMLQPQENRSPKCCNSYARKGDQPDVTHCTGMTRAGCSSNVFANGDWYFSTDGSN